MALDLTNNNIFLSKITNSKPQIVSTTVNNNGLNYLSSNTVSGSTKTSTVLVILRTLRIRRMIKTDNQILTS